MPRKMVEAITHDTDVTINTPCGMVHIYVRQDELTVDTRPELLGERPCRVTYVEKPDVNPMTLEEEEPSMIYGVIRRR